MLVVDSPVKQTLLEWIPEPPAIPEPSAVPKSSAAPEASMDIDTAPTVTTPSAVPSAATIATPAPEAQPQKPALPTSDPLPEGEVYLRLLIIHFLLASPTTRSKAFTLAHETVEKIQAWNRRSLDALAARVWFALGRAYELAGELEQVRPYVYHIVYFAVQL